MLSLLTFDDTFYFIKNRFNNVSIHRKFHQNLFKIERNHIFWELYEKYSFQSPKNFFQFLLLAF